MIRPVRVDELELGTNLVRGDLGLQVIHHKVAFVKRAIVNKSNAVLLDLVIMKS